MKKYIDVDLLKSELEDLDESGKLYYMGVFDVINSQPTADVAEVVRCKDCKYMSTIFPMKSKGEEAIETHVCYLSHWAENSHGASVMENDYCSYGKRAERE